ncbi:hypothetical protein EIL87_24440 [Saccharopolyspora rhizosphaerae]|uniref:Uncharacterized protein n=1 Tax=Saccharopolyspora rhizosphaerae TaxID=2492662 RepID=A0A3R8PY17_9PSEU|nr:hypothetical protein [Saccharopolyspora rhizosphaerae]RRO12834.1 hypothetical protein EIL87_24440 [Saccharopolyspora rhizosphaerae]
MSQYQYYEFLAVERPLSEDEQGEVQQLSDQAVVSDHSFVAVHEQDEFRGDPDVLVESYYDAHLHVTSSSTRRLMVRFPNTALDDELAEEYEVAERVEVWSSEEHVVLDFLSEEEGPEDPPSGHQDLLEQLIGIREEVLGGDLRPLYLAWLAGYGAWERDEFAFDTSAEDEAEPVVPPGLGQLSPAQTRLADFLRLDEDLLAVAAEHSTPLQESIDPTALGAWVSELPSADKDLLLLQVAQGQAAEARVEMLRRFNGDSAAGRRTVGELLDQAARRRS